MLSLDKHVKLVAGDDLNQFNPLELWEALEDQRGVDFPSPHIKTDVIDVDVSLTTSQGK